MGIIVTGWPKIFNKTSVYSRQRQVYVIALLVFGLFTLAGCLSLSLNSLEKYSQLLFGLFSGVLLFLFVYLRIKQNTWDKKIAILFGISILYSVLLFFIPEYLWEAQMDGITHRSLLTGIVLVGIGVPAFCSALYYLLGATPSAKQASRYPIIILPVLMILLIYGIMVAYLFIKGIPHLDWGILTSFLRYEGVTKVPGMANYILGTITLILLTSIISLPIGIGTGIYISEYAGRLSGVVRLCTTALRSISVFILALGAYSVVKYSQGTIFNDIFAGFPDTRHGSFWWRRYFYLYW